MRTLIQSNNMAKPPHVLLADSLERVAKSSKDGIVRSEYISRRDRERLVKTGWLSPIITGWYLLVSPKALPGESTPWFASFWTFVQQYLDEHFKNDYCLSAESSLDIHTADNLIPKQIVVITKASTNYTLTLPHHTSLLIYQDIKKFPAQTETKNKLQVMPVNLALCRASKSFFLKQPMNAKIALDLIRDPSEIIRPLLEGYMAQAAGRLAGAFRHIGRDRFADEIIQTMKTAGFDVSEDNPFNETSVSNFHTQRVISPYHARIINMWAFMRNDVIHHFKKRNPTKATIATVMQRINDIYVNDAYNSLSIEGYQVSKSLIAKIQAGEWNPDMSETDYGERNALAAKGYYLAFLAVKESITRILEGANVVDVIQRDLAKWYQALFSPSVDAGLIKLVHLTGYRDDRVFIRHSLHVPPPKEAVLDCMDAFLNCLRNEENPIVRAVLGHFIFVFIHPYMDGNGRIGRFLMNVLWSAAGYPWTIVRLESRTEYLHSLETASVKKNITPFTIFLDNEMSVKS